VAAVWSTARRCSRPNGVLVTSEPVTRTPRATSTEGCCDRGHSVFRHTLSTRMGTTFHVPQRSATRHTMRAAHPATPDGSLVGRIDQPCWK
jgi:hypothetical protein